MDAHNTYLIMPRKWNSGVVVLLLVIGVLFKYTFGFTGLPRINSSRPCAGLLAGLSGLFGGEYVWVEDGFG